MITFQEFKQINVRPNLELVNLSKIDFKTVNEVEQMTLEDVINGSFVIVCNNMKWLAKSVTDTGRTSYYSYDGEFFYLAAGKRKSILKYVLENNTLELTQTYDFKFKLNDDVLELNKNKNQKEEKNMVKTTENSVDTDKKETNSLVKAATNPIDEIMRQANMELDSGASVTPMKNFDGDSKEAGDKKGNTAEESNKDAKEAGKSRMESLLRQIKNDVKSSTSSVDMSLIQASWSKLARLICFVTPADKRQSLSAVKIPVPAEKKTLVDDAPEDIKQLWLKNPSAVNSSYIKVEYEIKAREGKPGKPVGVIAKIPAFLKGCSLLDYTKSVSLEGAKSNNDEVAIEMFTFNDFEQKLALVGSSILEAEETAPSNGKPGEINVVINIPTSGAASNNGVLENTGIMLAKKLVKVGNGNKTPLHDDNYFPLVTYKTVDITQPMPEDVLADLNQYTFEPLFSPGKNSKQVGSKYRLLVESSKNHIVKDKDKITSDYITNDGGKRVSLTMTAFYDKSVVRPAIELPLKRRNEKTDGTLGSPQFIKYNVTLEDKMSDPEYRANSSLGNEKFKNIIDIVGESFLNPASLRDKFKRSNGNKGASHHLSAEMARELLINKLNGGLENYAISGFTFD